MAKTRAQSALDKLNEKYGLTTPKGTTTKTEEKQSESSASAFAFKPSGKSEPVSKSTGKPQSALEKLNIKYGLISGESTTGNEEKGVKRSIESVSPSRTATQFDTDAQNAYSNVTNRLNTRTTITSELSEQERTARIKEIKTELGVLNSKASGYSRAKAYGASKALLDAEKKDKERIAELSQELKKLERVGTFTRSEMLQWEIDDARAKKNALPTINPSGRMTASQADAYLKSLESGRELDAEIARLEAEKAEYKKIEQLGELNAHTAKITTKGDYEKNSKYSPRAPKTVEQLKAEGYKQDDTGAWYKMDGLLGGRKTYTGEDSDLYTYVNDVSMREKLGIIATARYGTNIYEDLGYNTLNEDETGAFNYLYHQDRKNGTNTAEAYLQTISPLLQQRAMEAEAKRYAEVAKEHPVASSVISLGTNAQNAMMFPAKVVTTATGMYDDMPSIDMFGNRTQAIRGAVSEDMGVVGKLAYNATMSIGDMGVAMLVGGGNAKAIQAIMSSSAGSSTISEAKKNGASDGKAFVLGLGAAAIEWATEKYSVEAILKEPESILGYIGTNILTEGSEEGASNIANTALDAIVSEIFGEKNEIEQRMDYLMLYEGKTADEALEIAFLEKLQSLGEDILVGGLTGAGMSTTVASPAIVEKGINGIRNSSNKTNTQEGNNATDTNITQDVNAANPDALEQAARDVIAQRSATQTNARRDTSKGVSLTDTLEAQSRNNEPIAVEDVKKATGLGEYGSKLISRLASSEGMTFSQAEKAVKNAYMAGFADVDSAKVDFVTDTQIDAFTAGKTDRVMQDLSAKESANQKRAKSGMSAEESYNFFDSLTEDDNRIRITKVNGITIRIDKRFGGGYFVVTEFNNGEKITPWTKPEEFDTFEEAKTHAAMLSFDAAEYDGGLAPVDKFYGRNVSGVKVSGTGTNSGLNNEPTGSIISTNNISGVVKNADIRKHDGVGETQLRENEEEGLHGRGNQGYVVANQESSAGTQRRSISSNRGKNDSEVQKRGLVRNGFHGTPFVFANHKKSYVDIGIHYGNEEQAKARLFAENGNVIKSDLILENPLVTKDIFGERTPEQYVKELIDNSNLTEEEKKLLEKSFSDYLADGDLENMAASELSRKIFDGSHLITTEFGPDGLYVSLAILDDASNICEIPLAELIDKNVLLDVFGLKKMAQILKDNKLSEADENILKPYLFEAVLPFEIQYLKLRKIEEILQSFSYDGFAYKNENEGEGWSYAVFDDSQIIRGESAEEASTETNADFGITDEKSLRDTRVAAKTDTDKFQGDEDTDELAMWTTNRVGDEVKPKSISEIVATIEHEFGINITTGHIRGEGVLGQYNNNNRGVRTKIANNLPVISHELGHYFERTLGIESQLTDELIKELTSNLDKRTIENYPKNKLVREGVAEYVRRFLQNRETAAIDYSKFNDFFLKLLPSKDLAKLQQLADDINAYYSLDADTATSSIRLSGEGVVDLRTPIEKLQETADGLYQAWVDSNHAIKRFDRATGSNAYMLASNAAYSDARAGQIVVGDLTDKNGQYVSSGLKTVLHGIDLSNKEEYRLFGEYLTVKHGPERLNEGMRVFADDRKNSSAFMERRQAELEKQYPEFKEASERLYAFIKQFYKTWGVETGLISQTTLDGWSERWQYYVPFNRVMEKGKGGFGAKRGFANQNSTIKKARGSGRDIKHPIDNLIENIVKMVNAGVRNDVMRTITTSAEKFGADATFLEQVPMPVTATKMDMTGVKDTLTTWLEESDMDADSKDKASGIVKTLDDVLFQYGRGKTSGNVVTVLNDGTPQAWKINDVGLLQSLTSLSPKTMDGLLDAIAITSRFMTSNITGNNLIWSIFSNLPRDTMTFFTYSKNKDVIEMAKGVGSAYLNKVKGDKADPLYKEFLAMGGGKTSAYTADRNLAKDVRKKLSDRKFNPNPLDWLGFVSDVVEAGPRFATYKMMREAGMTPQEAFYESMDITVNFRRGGRISREINKAVPFFNASIQGLDKFRRWITAEDVKGVDRKKAVRTRAISYVAVSIALAAISYAINNGDDEKEEDYEQLSTYTKNSYWVIPVGDGKYFAIPKPREIGVLSSFFETCLEYGIGENDHAFDEFYSYASENFLPAIANDIAQVWSKGLVETGMNIIGSLGIIGVMGYLGANRDFLGRPIVASGLQNLEPKDQYTDRTSKLAYWLGRAFNGSPEQIDYAMQQILGGWWKYQKALFPVGEKNKDYTLGVGNTYIKDNQYSTDLTNWLYDRADATAKSKNSNPDDMEKAITAKWDSNMVDFYGTYYKKAKSNSQSTSARSTRQLVLDIIKEYQKGIDGDYKTDWQKAVEQVCKDTGSTEYMPSVMPGEVTDGNGKKHNLSDVQYVEYQTDYLRLYWEIVEETLTSSMTASEKANILTAAKKVAKEQATEHTLKRIAAPSSEFAIKYEGVKNDTLTEFFAGISEADEDNSVKKKEVVNVISGLDVDDDDAWKLYLSRCESKGANYAKENGINGIDYVEFVEALYEVDKPTESGKYGTFNQVEVEEAIRSIKGLSQEEKAILFQSVNTSWKKNPFR